MKLIIQEIIKAKRIILCFLIIILIKDSNSKSLKTFNIEETIKSENLEDIEPNRVNNETTGIKKGNLKINFKFANVSLVFPQPLEHFRLSYDENNEENRKSINPLLIPNNIDNNEKANTRRTFFGSNNNNNKEFLDKNNLNSTSSRSAIKEKIEYTRSNSTNTIQNNIQDSKLPQSDRQEKKFVSTLFSINKRIESFIPIIINTRSSNNIESNIQVNLRTNNFNNNPQVTNFVNHNTNLVDMSQLSYECAEIGCEWCDKTNTKNCKQCKYGFFMYIGKCYTICPKEYVADIYTRSCTVLDNTNVMNQISYVKAFSVGSCKNLCGKNSLDCSCSSSCIQAGNCCADYQYCENLNKINHNRNHECYAGNPNCDLCENFVRKNDPSDISKIIPFKCGKCREGFFLKYGECREKCDSSDKIIAPNQVCFDTMNCLVENCAQCGKENSAVCRICQNGTFMHNNQCLKECPRGLRADRISWTCIEPPVAAWYWIWPSKASCRLRCGRRVDFEMDCSCADDCFAKGNCCVDVEDYCPQFVSWK